MKIKVFELLLLVFLSACTFNKIFYKPSGIPAGKKKGTMINNETKDTTIMLLADDHQPTFTATSGATKELEYTIKSYNFKSNSGNLLNGWMVTPNNVKPRASILFLHSNAGHVISQYPGLIPLVKKGYQVFIFDYSGYGFSEGKATRGNVLKDANAALDFVKSLPEVMNTKLIIYGQSMGGHLSVVLASENQEKIDGLVVEGAFSSHKDIGARTAGFIGRMLVKEKYSAKQSIKNFRKPLLVIHSVEDETIPFKHGQTIYGNANEPKQFYQIKGYHTGGPVLYTDSIDYKIKELLLK